jgi:hypothetical protein
VRKGVLVVAGVLVSALLFSGCFAMRTLTFSDDTVQAGKKVTAKISVVGDTTDTVLRGVPGPEHPFFFAISEAGSRLANGGVFDTGGVFDGPVDLKPNVALAGFASDACEQFLPFSTAKRGVPDPPTAVTTDDPFEATNPRKFMNARVPIRAPQDSNGDALGIFMGSWTDDGDGVPEDEASTDDSYSCQPPYTTFIKIKGGTPPPP